MRYFLCAPLPGFGRLDVPCSPMRPAQSTGGRSRVPIIYGCFDDYRLPLVGEHDVKLELGIDDDMGAVGLKYRPGFAANREAVFEQSRRPSPLVLLAVRPVRCLDPVLRNFLREFLPRTARGFVGQVIAAGGLRREVADEPFAWTQLETHVVTLRRPLGREQPVVGCGRERACQIIHSGFAHVGRIPGRFHRGRTDVSRAFSFDRMIFPSCSI
jgi:hypothetical protein